MSAIWMRVRSELRTARRSVFALALLVAISGAAVLTPLAGARRTESAYGRFLSDSNAHDVETNEGVPGLGYAYSLDLDAVARLPEVAEYEIQNVFIVGLRIGAEEFPPGSEAVILRPNLFTGGGLSQPRLLAGRAPDPGRSDEVAVGYGLAVRDGVGVGDRITLKLLSTDLLSHGLDNVRVVEEVPVTVSGIIILPGAIPPAVRYGQIYATPAFEERFRGKAANAKGFFASLERGPEDLAVFKDHLVDLAGGNVQFLTSNDQDAGVKRSIDVYVVALQAFAGLAAAAALLIVTQTLARQLTIASVEHPALRSLGMTPGQLSGVALLRTAISAVVGLIGGVALAYGLSTLFPIGTARIVEPTPGFSFDPLVLLGGSAAIVLLIALFAVPATWRAGRRAHGVDDATQTEGQVKPSRLVAWFSGAGASTSVVAGLRLALERGRGRSATPVGSTIIASAVAVASIVTLVAFGANLRNLVEKPRLYGWNWDSIAGNPYAPDLGAVVGPALDGLDSIAEYSSGATNVRIQIARPGGASVDTQALALTARKGQVFPPVLEGRWPVDDDEVALGSGSMRSLGASIGDTIEASLAGEPIRVTIVGRTVFPIVGDQYGGELGRGAGFTLEGLRRITPNALENIFPVRFRPGFDISTLPPEGKDLFFFGDETDVVLGARPSDLVNLSKVTGAPLALTTLVGLLGVATIAHALATSVRRRRRDLAILKTLGFVKRQIWLAVVTQATTLALVALVIGIPVGLIMGRSAWLAFANRQGVVPEALIGTLPIIALIPATVFLANLVAALPGRAAARLSPATVLRTE